MAKKRLPSLHLPSWLLFIQTVVVVLLGDMVASLLYDSLNLWWQGQPVTLHWPGLLITIIFLLLAAWLYQQGTILFRPRTRTLRDEPARPSKHLILFLSNLPGEPADLQQSGGVPEKLPLQFQDIAADLAIMEAHKANRIIWPWEMPLRAMWEHAKAAALEDVTCICSTRSLAQLPLFLKICRKYPQFANVRYFVLVRHRETGRLLSAAELDPASGDYQGWDFERFDQLSEALWDLLDEFGKLGFQEADVMIDFTGGKKVTSVAAALITYNRQVKAQYVDTETCQVLSYDIVIPTPAGKGLDF